MLIRLGYDIELENSRPQAVVAVLNVHPTRAADLVEPDIVQISPNAAREEYIDSFCNKCIRVAAPAGSLRLWGSTLIRDSGLPDPVNRTAEQVPVDELPTNALQYLLASRYCEVDRLSDLAWQLFGGCAPGWPCVQAICDWVHQHITFGYNYARPTRTAFEAYVEKTGVCRDFQHLAISLCRCMHIPARYATGYLWDIGVPADPNPMDFSAWFEAYLDGGWWTFDARHNKPRIGRVLIATGRDAADVAITTSFGVSWLRRFSVVTHEVAEEREALLASA
jgi:transglutaminase-like putative cysteine protease